MVSAEPGDSPAQVGLCARCTWMRRITSRRGSVFYLCGRHREDPTFRKYPPLPVLDCRGFEPVAPDRAGGGPFNRTPHEPA